MPGHIQRVADEIGRIASHVSDAAFRQAHAGSGGDDQFRLMDRGQRCIERPIGKAIKYRVSQRHGQAGLADAGRSEQAEQTHIALEEVLL